MRTCDLCGKNIDHKRADAKFCGAGCRSRHALTQRGRGAKEGVANNDAVAHSAPTNEARLASPGPTPGEVDTESVSTSRPPREPPRIVRPPDEHLREPDASVPALEKRLYEVELRMNAFDLEQPWQDWYHDAKEASDEAKAAAKDARKSAEDAKRPERVQTERLDELEQKLADVPTKAALSAMIEEKLRPLWREIDRVDKATAARQAVEKLADQVRELQGRTGGDARLESIRDDLARLKTQVDDVADAQRSLERSMVVFSKAVARTLKQIAGGDE